MAEKIRLSEAIRRGQEMRGQKRTKRHGYARIPARIYQKIVDNHTRRRSDEHSIDLIDDRVVEKARFCPASLAAIGVGQDPREIIYRDVIFGDGGESVHGLLAEKTEVNGQVTCPLPRVKRPCGVPWDGGCKCNQGGPCDTTADDYAGLIPHLVDAHTFTTKEVIKFLEERGF